MIEIDLSKVDKTQGESITFQYEGTPHEWKDLCFARPLILDMVCAFSHEDSIVSGHINTALSVVCDRCLSDIIYEVDLDVDEIYKKDTQADDEESYTYTGETIYLDKMVYDAIMLALPQVFLCKEDCLGLCQQCGQNLNEKRCDCKKDDTEKTNPFIELKGLF
ncbi:MAG: YceD family protein [Christensenellaceae bacterium]